MTSIKSDISLEDKLREYWRLRRKYTPRSPQGRSYREAIREQIGMLRALRLARHANRDLLLPPMKKHPKPQFPSHEAGSTNLC